ncbi:MAG: hypothetical protein L6R00_11845 [Phycisphaerae bacterium]|nr:hypothetical protein [Phycisphaerae bacterium]
MTKKMILSLLFGVALQCPQAAGLFAQAPEAQTQPTEPRAAASQPDEGASLRQLEERLVDAIRSIYPKNAPMAQEHMPAFWRDDIIAAVDELSKARAKDIINQIKKDGDFFTYLHHSAERLQSLLDAATQYLELSRQRNDSLRDVQNEIRALEQKLQKATDAKASAQAKEELERARQVEADIVRSFERQEYRLVTQYDECLASLSDWADIRRRGDGASLRIEVEKEPINEESGKPADADELVLRELVTRLLQTRADSQKLLEDPTLTSLQAQSLSATREQAERAVCSNRRLRIRMCVDDAYETNSYLGDRVQVIEGRLSGLVDLVPGACITVRTSSEDVLVIRRGVWIRLNVRLDKVTILDRDKPRVERSEGGNVTRMSKVVDLKGGIDIQATHIP